MIVFFPIGFICGLNFYRIKAIYRLARRFRSGIKDEGAFITAVYKGTERELVFDSQVYALIDDVYKDYIPDDI